MMHDTDGDGNGCDDDNADAFKSFPANLQTARSLQTRMSANMSVKLFGALLRQDCMQWAPDWGSVGESGVISDFLRQCSPA